MFKKQLRDFIVNGSIIDITCLYIWFFFIFSICSS